MIPPCRFYKPYYGPQDLIAANGTPIRIFGTKKLNIDVGARYTLRWTFKLSSRCQSTYHRHRFYAPLWSWG